MQWNDFDPGTYSVTIERQWAPGNGGQYPAPPKSEDWVRSIILGQLSLGLIERDREIMREILRREPEGWMLSYDAEVTPLRAKALGQATTGLGKGLGLEVTTHPFQRVSAAQLISAGVDTAARRMGHTKEVMLASYVIARVPHCGVSPQKRQAHHLGYQIWRSWEVQPHQSLEDARNEQLPCLRRPNRDGERFGRQRATRSGKHGACHQPEDVSERQGRGRPRIGEGVVNHSAERRETRQPATPSESGDEHAEHPGRKRSMQRVVCTTSSLQPGRTSGSGWASSTAFSEPLATDSPSMGTARSGAIVMPSPPTGSGRPASA